MNNLLPTSIALELVPRSLQSLCEQSQSLLKTYAPLQAINVPELCRMEIKSAPAAEALLAQGLPVVPHFRTVDRSLEELETLVAPLVNQGLNEVLLISGDPPKDQPGFVSSGVTPVMGIQALKARFPGLKVYAGLDGYRWSFRKELDYAFEKIEAGCDGFFTQPFFSERLLELWLEQLPKSELWVGVSPVTTQSSRHYWEKVNSVVFPPHFGLDLASNCALNRRLLHLAANAGQKAYLMPITISAEEYLAALFAV